MVSPSGTAQQVPARRAHEAGRAQRLRERRLVDRRAVDLFDEERIAPFRYGLGGQRPSNERADARDVALLTVDEGEGTVLVAGDVRGERAVDQDHERPRDAHRLAAALPLGPAERGAVRVRRIGGGERDHGWLLAGLTHRPEPIDGTRQRELRGTTPCDEVAATHAACLLHRAQYAVDGSEATVGALVLHELAGDDAVPLEELQHARREALGRCRRRAARRGGDERPAPDELAREAALRRSTPAGVAHGRRPQDRAEWVQAVVRHLAGPDEVPERVLHLGGEAAAERRDQLREERRAARRERFADPVMGRAILLRWRRHEGRVLREEECDLAVARPARSPTDPDRGTRCEQRVEVALVVPGDA